MGKDIIKVFLCLVANHSSFLDPSSVTKFQENPMSVAIVYTGKKNAILDQLGNSNDRPMVTMDH